MSEKNSKFTAVFKCENQDSPVELSVTTTGTVVVQSKSYKSERLTYDGEKFSPNVYCFTDHTGNEYGKLKQRKLEQMLRAIHEYVDVCQYTSLYKGEENERREMLEKYK